MECELAFHDDNFCKFHVPYACISDACAVETRWRFVPERRLNKIKKESRNLNPGLTAWVKIKAPKREREGIEIQIRYVVPHVFGKISSEFCTD